MKKKKELKELLFNYGFRPRRSFGQNFLVDENAKERIIRAAGVTDEDTVVEIGPGIGALTIDLAKKAKRVLAVEKDARMCSILGEMLENDGIENVTIFNEDILEFDLAKAVGRSRSIVVGNLPYCITSPILHYFIRQRERISAALITIQREVSDRLLAKPHSKEYGSLTCLVQFYFKPSRVFTMPRNSFYPAPEVSSNFVRLVVRSEPPVKVKNEELMFLVIRAGFNQRRKTFVNAVANRGPSEVTKERVIDALRECGISEKARAEDLALSDYAKVTNVLAG
ncbi:MAG: 16S rRNA (adenine(1518)-N(6)/adenine(1519)-N(6))-dimethyltransferase RsmA [Candidatus Omnitrophota bacterium]